MNISPSPAPSGKVASLHLHPAEPGAQLLSVDEFEVVCDQGVQGEPRYFNRMSRRTGEPTRRQVSLIEREQIAEHAAALGLETIPPGMVRANIETFGIDLVALVGHEVQIGEAVLFIAEPRIPCAKMDAICSGLWELMKNDRQGVLAQVVSSGRIRVGDLVTVRVAARNAS